MENREIQFTDIWNDEKRNDIKKIVLEHSSAQTKEMILTNRLLAIQYKLEDYIQILQVLCLAHDNK